MKIVSTKSCLHQICLPKTEIHLLERDYVAELCPGKTCFGAKVVPGRQLLVETFTRIFQKNIFLSVHIKLLKYPLHIVQVLHSMSNAQTINSQ